MSTTEEDETPEVSQMDGTVEGKLVRSHLIVAALGVVALVILIFVNGALRRGTERLAESRAPAAVASTRALSSVNASLASLRGWMLLGEEQMKTKRELAWEKGINPALAELTQLSKDWNGRDAANRVHLEKARTALAQLHEVQWWIEEIANSPGRFPCQVHFDEKVAPVGKSATDAITGMIEEEKGQEGDPRTLGYMADFRAAFLQSLLALSDYVKTVESSKGTRFTNRLEIARSRLDSLTRLSGELTAEQNSVLTSLRPEFAAYETITGRLLAEVNHCQAMGKLDLANDMLANEAVPLAETVAEALRSMSDDQVAEMSRQSARVGMIARVTTGAGVVLVFGLAMLAWRIARICAVRFTRPLKSLSRATRMLAEGGFKEAIPVRSDDEIGQLTVSFNRMSESLHRSQEKLERRVFQAELLHRTVDDASTAQNDEDAYAMCLRNVCDLTGWPIGHAYVRSADGACLESADIWQFHAGHEFGEFRTVTAKTTFEKGMGLPGRIWAAGEPVWIVNVQKDPNFPRAAVCQRVGVKGGFGFPVAVDGEVEAVLEFFSEEEMSPDESLLAAVRGVGIQLGGVIERLRVESARRDEADRVRSLFSTAVDAIITISDRGKIEMVNPAATRLFGYEETEMVGSNINLLMPEPYHSEHDGYLKKYRHTGEAKVIGSGREVVGRQKDGTTFPLRLSVGEMKLATGRSFVGILSDLTLQKQAENALLQAKESAEESSRIKSEFLANMSHEIRTPMNGIMGMSELLLKTQLSSQQGEYMNMVYHSAETLLRLINDILDFSKIEAGKLELDLIPFALRDKLADILKLLAARAAEKGLELAYHIPPNVPDGLVGDSGRLQQILVNLVGNAIKFTHEGEVVVGCRLVEQDSTNVMLNFEVTDTGVGIPKQKQSKIFDSFHQADASTSREFGGTGLGLAISASLVNLMDGELEVESVEGRGSTFHFTARFGLVKDHESMLLKSPEELMQLPVLVVDDNATNRKIFDEMLHSWELKPTCVDSGPAALLELSSAHQRNEPYQVMILDCMMPGMDGFEVASKIREEEIYSQLRILMLSSAHITDQHRRARAAGVDRCLTKPVKQSDLFNAITRVTGMETVVPDEPIEAGEEKIGPPLKILMAEDGLVNQRVATDLLTGRGHHVTIARNGLEAVKAFEREPFDLVLMDIHMPEMDGYQATHAIREHEQKGGQGAHIAIVALTANAMKGDRERCLNAGMDDYLSKPIRAQKLFDIVDKNGPENPLGPPDQETPPPEEETFAFDQPQGDSSNTAILMEADVTSPGTGVIQPEVAMENVAGNEDILHDLIGCYFEETADLLKQLDQAIRESDAETITRAAHTIKSSVAMFGAQTARECAFALERIGKEERLSEALNAFDDLRAEIQRLNQAIESEWDRKAPFDP